MYKIPFTAKSTVFYTVEQIIRSIFNFLVIALMAKILDKQLLGLWNYLLSLNMILLTISSFGLDAVIIRLFVELREKSSSIMTASFLIRSLAGLISVGLFLSIIHFSDDKELYENNSCD